MPKNRGRRGDLGRRKRLAGARAVPSSGWVRRSIRLAALAAGQTLLLALQTWEHARIARRVSRHYPGLFRRLTRALTDPALPVPQDGTAEGVIPSTYVPGRNTVFIALGLSLAEVASIVPIIEKLRIQGKTIIMVTHELPSIFAIGNNSVFLDAEARTITASGDPRILRDASDDPVVRRFLNRGDT